MKIASGVMYTHLMNVVVNLRSRQEFGKRLREVREKKRLSQDETAELVGISVTYYAGMERGEENPTFAVIESICKGLQIKSSQILPF